MTYQTVVVPRFGGLDAYDEPAETGLRAFSLQNVDLVGDGSAVRVRDGLTTVLTGSSLYTRLCRSTSQSGAMEGVGAFRTTGAALQFADISGDTIQGTATWGSSSTRWSSDAFIGTPTAKQLFIASVSNTTPETLRRWDSTSTMNTSVGEPRHVAVTPWDNRLAQAGFVAAADSPTGANGSESTVFFSDAGAPQTYSANNFVHLRPGDQERICAMVTWRDYLLVLKETAMFVFYGVGTSPTSGGAIFNYRTVPLPMPCYDPLDLAADSAAKASVACVGHDGVYVRLRDGIYRTDGGGFTEVSQRIRSTIQSKPSGTLVYRSLSFAGRRLYVEGSTGSTGMLVYDTALDEWLLWSLVGGAAGSSNVIVANADATLRPEGDLLVAQGSSLYRFNESATADGATAIASHYQAGFADLGSPYEKRVRQFDLWGIGTPTLDVYTDHATSDPLSRGAAITLGVSPAVDQGWHRSSYQGTLFSHRFSASSGAWRVNRLTYHVADQRVR